jgi:octaprenyl-diphosphate synthase
MIAMSMAELAEDRVAFNYDQHIDGYLERIKGKTASLFAAAARGGALVSDASPAHVATLQAYGENLGMAFQIVDDILDFCGDEEEMGKPVGSDLMQGTLTLPSLLLIQRYPETNPIRELFQERDGPEHLARAIEMACESGILEESYKIARRFRDAACDALASLPAGAPRASLEELTDYVLERRT